MQVRLQIAADTGAPRALATEAAKLCLPLQPRMDRGQPVHLFFSKVAVPVAQSGNELVFAWAQQACVAQAVFAHWMPIAELVGSTVGICWRPVEQFDEIVPVAAGGTECAIDCAGGTDHLAILVG
jgi:hypothetical protein